MISAFRVHSKHIIYTFIDGKLLYVRAVCASYLPTIATGGANLKARVETGFAQKRRTFLSLLHCDERPHTNGLSSRYSRQSYPRAQITALRTHIRTPVIFWY